MNEHRSISLPRGGTLELDMAPGFLAAVRNHFGLGPDEYVTDDHLRMFVYGATKGALDRAVSQ